MTLEQELRQKLRKIEALFAGAATKGVNGGAKRDHFGGVRRDRLAVAVLSP